MEYLGKEIWDEDPAAADSYRARYAAGIQEYINKRNVECKCVRRNNMPPEKLIQNPEFYREKYKEMLGMKIFEEKTSKSVEKTYVGSDEICRIYRLSVYITDEIPFYSMLLLPHDVKEPMPLVIAQHGGGGTPELISDMNGKNNYNHMVQRTLARGTAVLAPQILTWSMTEIATQRAHAIPHNRKQTDIDLKRFGSSLTAMEISGIMKSLDYVCDMKEIDAEKIAMIGLSYGGYFAMHTMAADSRIKAGYCAGFFNDRDVYDWLDWTYHSSALKFQDAEVAALCAPRKLYVQVGMKDPVFDYSSALQEAERVKDYYAAYGVPDHFKFDVWDGGHTISDHDEGYEFLFSM